jgi:hypothetical protein
MKKGWGGGYTNSFLNEIGFAGPPGKMWETEKMVPIWKQERVDFTTLFFKSKES